MPQIINAYKARTNFGEVLNQVNYGKNSFIIQRANKKMAVILPIEIYEALTQVKDQDIELYSDKRMAGFLAEDKKR